MSDHSSSRDLKEAVSGVREPADIAQSADADKIVAHLLKVQLREVGRDTGNGYRSARLIAQHIDRPTTECRALLQAMADAGRIRRCDFANGLYWRSVNPLPWEPGGSLTEERARLDALWAGPLTVIVQAEWHDGSGKVFRDVKAYPEGLRDQAEAHVERENRSSAERRLSDRIDGSRLSEFYTPPATYRLVILASLRAATASPAQRSDLTRDDQKTASEPLPFDPDTTPQEVA